MIEVTPVDVKHPHSVDCSFDLDLNDTDTTLLH